MRINIKYKLSFIFILMLTAVLIGLFLLMQWSFDKGFRNYITNLEKQRLNALVQEIENRYTSKHDIQSLQFDKRTWRSLLKNSLTENSPEDIFMAPQQDYRRPHRQGPPPKHLMAMFDYRVSLLSADHRPIINPAKDRPIELQLPIKQNDIIIGYVQLIRMPNLQDKPHKNFIIKQRARFGIIVLAVIFLSSVLVILISGRTVAPIRLINSTVRKIAGGDFTARSNITSNDELGMLAQDINQLALTLDKNEQHRRQWVADISHELRTPVAVLRSHIEAIQDGIRECSDKNMDVMHKETKQLECIINDLYDLSMSDIGALNYAMEKTNILDVINQSISFYESAFDKKQIILTSQFNENNTIYVSADKNRLSQLFKNLLENSLKYTDANGRTELALSSDKSTVTLTFDDSAPGVPKEHLQHLFDRFYRVEKSRNKDTGGTGLGLSIAKQIIDAHQGDIAVSESPLGGIRITITLPIFRGSI